MTAISGLILTANFGKFKLEASYTLIGAAEVEHLKYLRGEIVRQIEERRAPLKADRDVARERRDLLENAYVSERRSREQEEQTMLEPKYERFHVNALESSAEILPDQTLLREVLNGRKPHQSGVLDC